MSENFNDVINKFSDILKEKNINLNNIINNSGEEVDSASPENIPNFSQKNEDFQLDMETILKLKDIMFKLDKNQNNSRNQLLKALKPYLEPQKRVQLDQYIKMASVIDLLDELEFENFFQKYNKKGYDLILIITLLLLIF